jgi:hypothetical protein
VLRRQSGFPKSLGWIVPVLAGWSVGRRTRGSDAYAHIAQGQFALSTIMNFARSAPRVLLSRACLVTSILSYALSPTPS